MNHHQNNNNNQLSNHPHLQGLRAVGLMPNPRPHAKSQKRKLELKCEYCPSTFISNNNLRRHIYELHKDVITHMPAPPEIKCDKYLHCRRCDMKFETKLEWIEHKVSEARVTKPYGPFQWGCDLCGAYVSRKEKLINHIHNHMKESVIVPVKQEQRKTQEQNTQQEISQISTTTNDDDDNKPLSSVKIKQETIETETVQQGDDEEVEEESADEQEDEGSVLSGKGAYGEGVNEEDMPDEDYEAVEVDAEVDDDEADEDEEEEDASSDEAVVNVNENANDGEAANSDEEEEEEEASSDDEVIDETEDTTTNQSSAKDDAASSPQRNMNNNQSSSEADVNDDDEYENMEDEDNTVSSMEDAHKSAVSIEKSRFSCDLCQVFFDSQPELQQHVKMHFLNGPGSVTFSNKSKQNTKTNNNNNGGNDAVTISNS